MQKTPTIVSSLLCSALLAVAPACGVEEEPASSVRDADGDLAPTFDERDPRADLDGRVLRDALVDLRRLDGSTDAGRDAVLDDDGDGPLGRLSTRPFDRDAARDLAGRAEGTLRPVPYDPPGILDDGGAPLCTMMVHCAPGYAPDDADGDGCIDGCAPTSPGRGDDGDDGEDGGRDDGSDDGVASDDETHDPADGGRAPCP